MVFFNHATRQMTAKIVYYGPGLCGKTTNLNTIYARTSQKARGEMVSLNTETDRTLFFDLLPMDVGVVGGFRCKLQLYTVPGQVFYNSTRKLVLKGVDGVVFVADSQSPMLEANKESLKNLEDNLRELGMDLRDIPMVFQWNKRDLRGVVPVERLEAELNSRRFPSFEGIASEGTGVFETLRGITKLSLAYLKRQHFPDAAPEEVSESSAPMPAQAQRVVPPLPTQALPVAPAPVPSVPVRASLPEWGAGASDSPQALQASELSLVEELFEEDLVEETRLSVPRGPGLPAPVSPSVGRGVPPPAPPPLPVVPAASGFPLMPPGPVPPGSAPVGSMPAPSVPVPPAAPRVSSPAAARPAITTPRAAAPSPSLRPKPSLGAPIPSVSSLLGELTSLSAMGSPSVLKLNLANAVDGQEVEILVQVRQGNHVVAAGQLKKSVPGKGATSRISLEIKRS